MLKLNAKELRTTVPDPEATKHIVKNPITIILDNVLDTYNVGSIFRLADAVAAEKVFLCGDTLTPPNSRIKKASVNTWQWVEWEYVTDTKQAIDIFKNSYSNGQVIAVEQDAKSVAFDTVTYSMPLAIIVGNETYGISRSTLDTSDLIIELPMWGINKSLNVMISCGIVLYHIMSQISKR